MRGVSGSVVSGSVVLTGGVLVGYDHFETFVQVINSVIYSFLLGFDGADFNVLVDCDGRSVVHR